MADELIDSSETRWYAPLKRNDQQHLPLFTIMSRNDSISFTSPEINTSPFPFYVVRSVSAETNE